MSAAQRRPPATLRVRTGCLTCRRRKKKCNEQRPVCTACCRNQWSCEWPSTPTTPPLPHHDTTTTPDSSSSSSGKDDLPSSPTRAIDLGFLQDIRRPAPPSTIPPTPPDIFAQMPDLAENEVLLSFYLARTATSMSNGSTDNNPFVVELIPLACSNVLVLQAILSQSAGQRALDSTSHTLYMASKHYSRSLRLLHQALDRLTRADEVEKIALGMAALIMCFTETARGDTDGAVFHHLLAADALISNVLSSPTLSGGLRDFIAEYYVYTATLSLISVDARYGSPYVLSPDLETQAQRLLAEHYVGHLCGAWLELLLLIPKVCQLGWRTSGSSVFPSAEDIALFSTLHHQIQSLRSPSSVSNCVAAATRVYQHAMTLYLWTTLSTCCVQDSTQGLFAGTVKKALSDAMLSLEEIPFDAQVNTNLCWPLAVIAACTYNEDQRQLIRSRLQTMERTVKLGNITQTLVVLESAWNSPSLQRGPWSLGQIMQENEICISFA